MRAAAIQFFATPFAGAHNLETAARLAREAVAGGARVVVLPELFNTGYVYSPRLTASAETVDGPTVGWLLAHSRALGVWLGGSLLLREADGVHNTLVLAGPGGQLHQYAKRHPFLWEGCYFAAGRAPVVAETDVGRLGLMVGWDLTRPRVWMDYAGKVEAVLLASSPPRVHRAVFNLPGGRKVYSAQLRPALLREREQLDELYSEYVGKCAAALSVPVIHAVMAGRFVAQLPLARLSWLGLAAFQPRYWALAAQARLASMRATFYGTTGIYHSDGRAAARVEGEAGVALAEVMPGGAGPRGPILPPRWPGMGRVFEWGLQIFARGHYRRQLRAAATC